MRKNKILPLAFLLVFVLLTTTVYAVHNSYFEKNHDKKAVLEETTTTSEIIGDNTLYTVEPGYGYIFDSNIDSAERKSLNEFYEEWYGKRYNNCDKPQEDETRRHIFNERNELKEEELKILESKNIDISKISSFEKDEGIFHINAAYINDYPEYKTLYIDYMNEHVGIGDYIPSGIYIDKDLNKAYFVSISDNKIYTYNL